MIFMASVRANPHPGSASVAVAAATWRRPHTCARSMANLDTDWEEGVDIKGAGISRTRAHSHRGLTSCAENLCIFVLACAPS